MRVGVQLHLTGTDHRAVARSLEITRSCPNFDIHPTTESVVAIFDGKLAPRTASATSRVPKLRCWTDRLDRLRQIPAGYL
jgi:hypothetical protein